MKEGMVPELRVLIVEDTVADAELVKRELRRAGLSCSCTVVDTREAFLGELAGASPSVILADYTLPSFDGMTALAIARERCAGVPFIFVSGTIGEERAISTLKMGATDYVFKDRLSQLGPAVHRALDESRHRHESNLDRERIARLNTVLRTFKNINHLIVHERDRQRLLQESCDLLVGTPSYRLAWIMLVDARGHFTSLASAGAADDVVRSLESGFARGEYLQCAREILAGETPFATCHDVEKRHPDCPLVRFHAGGAGFTCRLEHEGKIYGTVSVDVPRSVVMDAEEQELFRELAGDISYALASIESDARRQEAEERTRRFKEYLELQVNLMPTALMVWDTDIRVRAWNPAAERIFGFSAAEALGKRPHEIIAPPYSEPDIYPIWGKMLAAETNLYLVNTRKDGTEIVCEWLTAPLRRGDDTLAGILSIAQDVTETKRAEKALRRSEEKYRELANLLPQAICETDLEGKITFVNIKALSMFGYAESDFSAGLTVWRMLAPEDINRAKDDWVRILGGEELEGAEYTARKKDGSTFPVLVYASDIRHEDRATGLRLVVVDITGRRQKEAQLMVTDRLASIGELASGIAHELNNPLTGIIGLSELVLDSNVPDEVKQDLKSIRDEARRTARIVQGLLTFARRHPQEKRPVDISAAVLRVLELRAYEHKVNNISIFTRFAPGLPRVRANEFQLQQLFLNIIVNAEYFMSQSHQRGTLVITAERHDSVVRIGFADDGPGIPAEIMKHVFDPFFTTKEVGKGTGLGLSICHGIVTEHGGRIYAESEMGKGATFLVELPAPAELTAGTGNERR